MFEKVIDFFLKVINKRVCSSAEFSEILEEMQKQASFDIDGYITIGEMSKILLKSFKKVRGVKLANNR